MYEQFYGFTGRPFQLAPDPHFYFESGTHRKAMSYLGYGLAQGEGLIVITGEVGSGKTTLIGHFLNGLDVGRLKALNLVACSEDGADLLGLIAEQLGVSIEDGAPGDWLRGIEIALRSEARAGRRTLLIVDEAQKLNMAALEQLSLLSGLRLSEQPLMQIFLLGHPDFHETLFHTPALDALRQRVIATHHLGPMEASEVEPYIFHRLAKVGWSGNPGFSADAFAQFFASSEGVPHRLNALVTRVLLFGALKDLNRISGETVRDVICETAAGRVPAKAGSAAAGDAPTGAGPAPKADEGAAFHAVQAEEMAALRGKVAALEVRLAEQDAALRRVIDLLTQWVEPQTQTGNKPAATPEDIWIVSPDNA